MTCSPVLATTSCGDHPVPGADRGPPEGRERAAWQPQAPALAQGQQQLVPVWCGQPHGWSSHLHERSLQPGPAEGWGDTEQPPGPASSGSHLPGWRKGANPPPRPPAWPAGCLQRPGTPIPGQRPAAADWVVSGRGCRDGMRGAETASVQLTWGDVGPAAPPPEWPQEGVFLDQQRGAAHTHTGTGSPQRTKGSCDTAGAHVPWEGGHMQRAPPWVLQLLPHLGTHPHVGLCRTRSHAARKRASSWRPEGCGFQGGVRNEASGSTVREAPPQLCGVWDVLPQGRGAPKGP